MAEPTKDDQLICHHLLSTIFAEVVAHLEHVPKVFQSGPQVPKMLLYSVTL